MRNLFLLAFLSLVLTIPACSSSGPPPVDGGTLLDAAYDAWCCAPTPPPISCNSVWYGIGGTPAELPLGSCGAARLGQLTQCAKAKCAGPCVDAQTFEPAYRVPACDDCITVSCAAEVVACHEAP